MKKKWISLVLAAVMVLLCTACGQTAPQKDTAFTPNGSVIFEKDGLKVTTAGLGTDPTDGEDTPMIWVDIENTADKDACLGVSRGVVNGWMTDVVLVDFYEEEGGYNGASYVFDMVIPAKSTKHCGLGYYQQHLPGVDLSTLGEMELCFTLAKDEESWPDYFSDPVKITTDETVEPVDTASLGTVAVDDDKMTLVMGPQDYDDFFGPLFSVYMQNKSDRYYSLGADSAEGDGVVCDYVFFGEAVNPGKCVAGFMTFDDSLRYSKGIEKLTVNFSLHDSEGADTPGEGEATALEPVTVTYPPQVWGEYENDGMVLNVVPKYNELVTVETPADDENGTLFAVYETASVKAGGFDGAGWLFSIGRIGEEKLHEMLGYDMSGVQPFATDGNGSYYVYYHPTDVRFVRATNAEMESGIEQWSMLCEWADRMKDNFVDQNVLEYASFGTSEVEQYVARAAWGSEKDVTLSTTEFGPVSVSGVDATPYAEEMLLAWYSQAEDGVEAPDGEYVVLNFPEEGTRVDFFFLGGEDNYARIVHDDSETLYYTWSEADARYADVTQDWYYACARHAGLMNG